jgi:phage-related minor tail protein
MDVLLAYVFTYGCLVDRSHEVKRVEEVVELFHESNKNLRKRLERHLENVKTGLPEMVEVGERIARDVATLKEMAAMTFEELRARMDRKLLSIVEEIEREVEGRTKGVKNLGQRMSDLEKELISLIQELIRAERVGGAVEVNAVMTVETRTEKIAIELSNMDLQRGESSGLVINLEHARQIFAKLQDLHRSIESFNYCPLLEVKKGLTTKGNPRL